MSKGLRWFLLIVIFLVVFDYVIISYWRDDIEIDISASTLIIMLIGLPLATVFTLYVIIQVCKFIKHKLMNKYVSSGDDNRKSDNLTDNSVINLEENILLPAQHLFILETALITPFGNDVTQIMVELQKKKTAEPDPILKYENTYPYLSRRIQSMPVLNKDEKILFKQASLVSNSLLTDRAKRVEQITVQLFDKLSLVLRSIDIKQLYPQQEEIIKSENQARLHPEWISKVDTQISQELPVVYRPRPNLQVLYILPNHIAQEEKETLADIPKHCLKLLDINEQHDVSFHIGYVENSEQTQELIHEKLTEHLNVDHIQNPQLLLIMGVDSWIDQSYLDIKFNKEKESLQPTEGGFAILFSDQENITNIDPLASITKPLMYKCHQSMMSTNRKIAENLVHAVEQIQQAYEVNKDDEIFNKNEILIVDNRPIQIQSLIDLSSLSNHYQIDDKQIISISSIFNDTNTMISGHSLVIAIGNTIEKQTNTMLINNAGTQLGTSWIVTSCMDNIPEKIDTILGSSV